MGPAPTSSSSIGPDPRDPRRSGPHGAGRIPRAIRPPGRRHRLRGGDREPRRHRGPRQPRRSLGTGLRARAPAPRGARVSPAAETCRTALAEALISTRAEQRRRSPPATAASSTSAAVWPTRVRTDLYSTLDLIAGELHADKVCLSRWHPTPGPRRDPGGERRTADDEILLGRRVPADRARFSSSQEAAQVIVGRPEGRPAEVELLLSLGYRSC